MKNIVVMFLSVVIAACYLAFPIVGRFEKNGVYYLRVRYGIIIRTVTVPAELYQICQIGGLYIPAGKMCVTR